MMQANKKKEFENSDAIRSPHGATVLDLLLAGGLIFGVVFAFQVVFLQIAASSRDLQRLSDMREAEGMFQQLFRATGGYSAATQEGGCSEEGALLETCNFSRIGKRAGFRDPGNGQYRVSLVPNESTFAITFALERSHNGLAAGRHTLTPDGIR